MYEYWVLPICSQYTHDCSWSQSVTSSPTSLWAWYAAAECFRHRHKSSSKCRQSQNGNTPRINPIRPRAAAVQFNVGTYATNATKATSARSTVATRRNARRRICALSAGQMSWFRMLASRNKFKALSLRRCLASAAAVVAGTDILCVCGVRIDMATVWWQLDAAGMLPSTSNDEAFTMLHSATILTYIVKYFSRSP